jgi:hypothetical protein
MQFGTVKDVEKVAHRAALIQATGVFQRQIGKQRLNQIKMRPYLTAGLSWAHLLMAGEERVLSSAVRKTR